MDVGLVALITGLTPSGMVLPTTTDHAGIESFFSSYLSRDSQVSIQFRLRIPWKKAKGGDQHLLTEMSRQDLVDVDPHELAACLFQWYLNMFMPFETINIAQRMAALMTRSAGPSAIASGLIYYSRLSLVALMKLATSTLHSNWDTCVKAVMHAIEEDRSLIVGSNSLQELYVHLHMSGLFEIHGMCANPRTLITGFGPQRSTSQDKGLLAQPDLPALTHVALVVPRSKLKIFQSAACLTLGSPGIHLSVYNPELFDNSFYAIDAFFGALKGPYDSDTCEVEEDLLGWRGRSDLIVTCAVPTFPFLIRDRNTAHVALNIDSSPASSILVKQLGYRLIVFEAILSDRQNLRLLRRPPGIRQDQKKGNASSCRTRSNDEITTSVKIVDYSVQTFSKRVVYSHADELTALQCGKAVSVAQSSPCSLTLQLGKSQQLLTFPFSIDQSRSKTKIARKQGWIEVAVPPAYAARSGGYSTNPFPVVINKSQPSAWGMGRVNLHQQPSVPSFAHIRYLETYLCMGLSNIEKRYRQQNQVQPPLVDLKESILHLMLSFMGEHPNHSHKGKRSKAMILSTDNDFDTIIFAAALRNDRDTGSLVLDGFAVPLTFANLSMLSPHMPRLLKANLNIVTIQLSKDEEMLWKNALPAFVERCRFTWNHREECEYVMRGAIPVSTAHGESPLCSCVNAKDIDDFPNEFRVFS